eukprot:2063524-Rhodomonas_salina.1
MSMSMTLTRDADADPDSQSTSTAKTPGLQVLRRTKNQIELHPGPGESPAVLSRVAVDPVSLCVAAGASQLAFYWCSLPRSHALARMQRRLLRCYHLHGACHRESSKSARTESLLSVIGPSSSVPTCYLGTRELLPDEGRCVTK